MTSLIWVGFSLLLLVSGIWGLLEGKAMIGLGTRTGGATNPDFSITLTGNRAFVFNIVCFVTGLIAGVVWIVLYPRVAQTTLDNTAADVLKFCIVFPIGGGALCALWETRAASKLPPDVGDE